MRILFIILQLILISCESDNNFIKKAKTFKKYQYIYFKDSIKMLHPESDLLLYEKLDTKRDLRELSIYIQNFKFKYLKHRRIDSNNVHVFLEITKPNLAKIFSKNISNKNSINLKDILNKEKLPTDKINSKVHLKKYKNEWLVLFPSKEK